MKSADNPSFDEKCNERDDARVLPPKLSFILKVRLTNDQLRALQTEARGYRSLSDFVRRQLFGGRAIDDRAVGENGISESGRRQEEPGVQLEIEKWSDEVWVQAPIEKGSIRKGGKLL